MLSDSLGTKRIEYLLDINGKVAEKDRLLAEESHQKAIKEQKLSSKNKVIYILSGATFLGLMLIGVLLRVMRRIRKQNFEINRKTLQIEEANENLAKSNEELERFAHVASHDLKSPLKNIVSFTGLLRRNLGDTVNASARDSLNFIETSGKRMNELIEQILQYSKLASQSKETKQKEYLDLNAIVDEISHLQVSTNDRTVSIEAATLPTIEWNRSKIFLLLKNLIENGLKYNDTANPTVKLYTTTSKDGVMTVCIEDNGIGISEEYFDQIFVMFKRLHSQSKYEGTGLGLATCKKVVDEFGGELTLTSKPGKGSIFRIEFPSEMIQDSPKALKNTKVIAYQ